LHNYECPISCLSTTNLLLEERLQMLKLHMQLTVLRCEVPFRRHGVSINVTKYSESANVTVQLERPRACPYSPPVLEWENGNVTSCQLVGMVPIATKEQKHLISFLCYNLSLNAKFMLKVSANGVLMDVTPLPVCKFVTS